MSCKGPQHKSDPFRERIGNIGKTKSIKVDRNKCDCQSGAQPIFRIDNFNRIVVVYLELHEKRGDRYLVCMPSAWICCHMLMYSHLQESHVCYSRHLRSKDFEHGI
jgi:hypothetical protein